MFLRPPKGNDLFFMIVFTQSKHFQMQIFPFPHKNKNNIASELFPFFRFTINRKTSDLKLSFSAFFFKI